MLRHLRTPDLFTLLSLSVAITSIYFSLERHKAAALYVLPLCVVLDGVDGFVARLMRRSGVFGHTLDSLVDIIAFGITLVVYWIAVSERTIFDLIVVGVFLAAIVVREAGLNATVETKANYGLPNTMNGILFPVCFWLGWEQVFPILFLISAILMLMPIRIPKPRIAIDENNSWRMYFG